ncbi:PH domain-containing protein [Streptomyces yaizuensis]|uniref:PH domain-containing protein n=1 Tax=Streptomyces yaizuensis TaxID=2989713 RepID=A0ABQ5P6P8_9ACTN|nr:PH domain-containing protein [Streptomyces sp. YSPA8]GLF98260.1 PH domain-containing protein [Streptomyces sp. YSPA8]
MSLWRLTVALSTLAAALLAAGIFGLLVPQLFTAVPSWTGWTGAGVLLAWGAGTWLRLRTAWLHSGYNLTQDEVLVMGGVLFRRQVALPYGRIQTIEVGSGPLQRRFGLATVTVATGAYHRAKVADIETAEAERIRNVLTPLASERQVAL